MLHAVDQVRIRQRLMFDGDEFLRTYDDNGKRGGRNWARGIAWQILGMARTMDVAVEMVELGDLIGSFQRFTDFAIEHQKRDGLWSVYIDSRELPADTSGSAAIAAALAIGRRRGWLGESAAASADQAIKGLRGHLTADGLLGGVAQSNKGGASLQRGDYRVISQFAMGLMSQLIAARA